MDTAMSGQAVATRLTGASFFPVLAATDIARARKFYSETLGLSVEDAPIPGQFFVNAAGGTRGLVYETTAPHGQNTAATFLVGDLAAVVSELRGRGVVFEEYDMPQMKTVDGIVDMGPMGKAAWFMDSEGNTLNIAQM
jgi:predicted enzyme related to lactoylglutathione lyase